MAEPMTPEQLAEIRTEVRPCTPEGRPNCCAECDTAALLGEVDRLTARVDELMRDPYPACTAMVARASKLEVLLVRAQLAHTGESGESMGDVLDAIDHALPLKRHDELRAAALDQASGEGESEGAGDG